MKISKVNNVRTAVALKNSEGKTGLLYKYPSREQNRNELQDQIKKQVKSGKYLYCVFNTTQGKRTAEVCLAGELNRQFPKDISIISEKELYKKITDFFARSHSYSDEMIRRTVDQHLRKTLYRTAGEDLKTLLLAGKARKSYTALSKEESGSIDKFVKYLKEDYQYLRVTKHVSKSIEHQNMLIQPDDNGVFVPSVIPLSSRRNREEKDAFTLFLTEYAVLDERKRKELRQKLRRLVDLYFYGPESVIREDFDEWKVHKDHRQDTAAPFSEEVAELAGKWKSTNIRAEKNTYIKNASQLMRAENIKRYRACISKIDEFQEVLFEDERISRFWIHHIENAVERIYTNWNTLDAFRLTTGYLGEKVWKDLLNALSIKYIAIGKAVYHFALNGEDIADRTKDLDLGTIDEKRLKGLTSFDYEQLKAEEMLQRSIAVYVAFSANHLAEQTTNLSSDHTDFLTLNKEQLNRYAKPNIRRNVLQFFGGESSWKDFAFDKYFNENYTEYDFLADLQQILYALRNESFHFDTKNHNPGNWNRELIGAMFEHDCRTCSVVQKNKFYSNNLPMFYGENVLRNLLNALYAKQTERASQIPSFNRVIVRRNFQDFLDQDLGWKGHFTDDLKTLEKWESALYYLLKEIYYNLFLREAGYQNASYDLRGQFIAWCEDEKGKAEEKDRKAIDSFYGRIKELAENGELSFSEICQAIMTEYNLYNGNKKVKSTQNENTKDHYAHYRMLLYKGIRQVFAEYLKKEFELLSAPSLREKMEESAFLPDYKTGAYEQLSESLRSDIELQKWYILGRFLNAKQANLLVGALRHYMQYSNDIARRAEKTKNTVFTDISLDKFRGYAAVLDVCLKLSGVTTNNLQDYFEDNDDYAKHIRNYLAFDGNIPGVSLSVQLGTFCSENIGDDEEESGRIQKFYDAANPIINRNVLFAKLYGSERILGKALAKRRITKKDFQKFNEKEEKIKKYRNTGKCKTEEEQRDLKIFQEMKNRVEFRDIMEYQEILDELQAQLIDWCYLRERDLMYFQLGFHYMCLKGKGEKEKRYQALECKGRSIKGAILYQIVAMYTNGLPVYTIKGNAEAKAEAPSASTGTKITLFTKYSKKCQEADGVKAPNENRYYNAGLELFENVEEHDNISALRNYIEHFKYFSVIDRSMLDIYSEVFDRFFTYDLKYQKNVINVFYNILMRHFIRPVVGFGSGRKAVGAGDSAYEKKRASFFLKEGRGLTSEEMAFKLDKEQDAPVKLNAKSGEFLKDVAVLLYFPGEVGDVVKENENKASHKNKKSWKQEKNRKDRKTENHNKSENFGTQLGECFKNLDIAGLK